MCPIGLAMPCNKHRRQQPDRSHSAIKEPAGLSTPDHVPSGHKPPFFWFNKSCQLLCCCECFLASGNVAGGLHLCEAAEDVPQLGAR